MPKPATPFLMERYSLTLDAGQGEVALESHGFSFAEALSNACLAVSHAQSPRIDDFHAREKVVIEERGETLDELASLVLCDLLSQANEKELLVKEVELEDFRREEGSAYSVRLVALGGSLEQADSPQSFHSVEVGPGAVKVNEAGNWTINATIRLQPPDSQVAGGVPPETL